MLRFIFDPIKDAIWYTLHSLLKRGAIKIRFQKNSDGQFAGYASIFGYAFDCWLTFDLGQWNIPPADPNHLKLTFRDPYGGSEH